MIRFYKSGKDNNGTSPESGQICSLLINDKEAVKKKKDA